MLEKRYFRDLEVGDKFYCNGNVCLKRSSRTALILRFNKVFYYGNKERVTLIPSNQYSVVDIAG